MESNHGHGDAIASRIFGSEILDIAVHACRLTVA